jgi:hypothetical protein
MTESNGQENGIRGGKTDTDLHYGEDSLGKRLKEEAELETAAIKKAQAPAGALNLPPLLEARRLEYGITNGAFDAHAMFERVIIFQLLPKSWKGGKIAGGRIWAPTKVLKGAVTTAARGIIVSAGLRALDVLRSNGSDLGHIVHFIKVAPYSTESDCIDGKWHYVLQMNVGDIVADEDIGEAMVRGEVTIVKNGSEHEIMGHGKALTPWVSDDA